MTRFHAVLCSLILLPLLAVAPSPAAAIDDRACTPLRIDGAVEIVGDVRVGIVVSGDHSTQAVLANDGGQQLVNIIDLDTGATRGLPMPPGRTRIVGLTHDGTKLLVNGQWGDEGVDPDVVPPQVYVIDTDTNSIEPVSELVGVGSADARSISAVGDRVLFEALDAERTPYLWDDGVVSTLPRPDGVQFLPPLISDDGTTVLYVELDAQARGVGHHVLDISSGTIVTLVGMEGRRLAMSADGSVIVGRGESNVAVWRQDTGVVEMDGVVGPFSDSAALDASGTMAFWTTGQNFIDPATGAETFRAELRQLNTVTGEVRSIAEHQERFADFRVLGVSDDGRRVLTGINARFLRPSPVPRSDVASGGFVFGVDLVEIDLDGDPFCPLIAGYSGALDDQVARLYAAYFDRAPDAGGLEFWRFERINGRSFDAVSAAFAASPEFVETYGDLDDEAFVDLVYANVLKRSPDAGGRAFWIDQLLNGRTRGSLMALFSDSPEFVEATGTVAPESAAAGSIRRLYAALLGRSADTDGLAYWVGEVASGASLETIAARIATTDEFQQRYGGLEDDRFSMASIAFGNLLDRQIDPLYTDPRYIEQITAAGVTPTDLLLGIVQSPEAIARTASMPVGG